MENSIEKSTVKKPEDWDYRKLIMDFDRFLADCEKNRGFLSPVPIEDIRKEYHRLFVDMIEVKS